MLQIGEVCDLEEIGDGMGILVFLQGTLVLPTSYKEVRWIYIFSNLVVFPPGFTGEALRGTHFKVLETRQALIEKLRNFGCSF